MKDKSKKVKSRKLFLGVMALIGVLLIGSIMAYFTDGDTATNTFVVGKVSIELQEPNWDENNAKDITPNLEVQKDPQILNDGENPAYVFLEVQVPYGSLVTAESSTGEKAVAADTELWGYDVKDGWVEVGTPNKDIDSGMVTHLYVYGTLDNCTELASGATTPTLFDWVRFANFTEDQGLEESIQNIVINAYAIQIDNIYDGKTNLDGNNNDGKVSAEEVWRVIYNQSPSTAKSLVAGLYNDEGTMLYTWNELVNDFGIDVEKDYIDKHHTPTFTSVLKVPGMRFSYANEEMSIINDDLSQGTKLVVDNSVTKIGAAAFTRNSTLKEIVLPNNVTSIGMSAFNSCSNLTSINIPESVTSIGSSAFSGCLNLTSINIPESVTSIGSSAFSGCTGLTSINIPNSVTSIENNTFQDCTGLTSINIPNSVTSIENNTFQGCTGLTSINIPNSVTSIGQYAFHGCTGLTSINIPNSVTSIKSFAFNSCSNLTTIHYSGTATEAPWGATNATVMP